MDVRVCQGRDGTGTGDRPVTDRSAVIGRSASPGNGRQKSRPVPSLCQGVGEANRWKQYGLSTHTVPHLSTPTNTWVRSYHTQNPTAISIDIFTFGVIQVNLGTLLSI